MPGLQGENKEYELKLKMIADVGFIGFPNAGKSTLLAAVIISKFTKNLYLFSKLDYKSLP